MFDPLKKGSYKGLFGWKIRAQDAPPNTSPNDSYFEKVLRYIPADVIAAWVAMSGVIAQSGTSVPKWLEWAVFFGLLTLIPFYVCYLKTDPPGLTSNKMFHWATSCLAFISWVFALGGPFLQLKFYQPVYGTVILIFVTLIIPVLERRFVKDPGGTTLPKNGAEPNKVDKAPPADKKDDAPPPGK